MARYRLSPQAQKSLIKISAYTLENYGLTQKKRYMTLLRNQMRAAAKAPQQGKDRSDIKVGYFSVNAEKHTIYYRIRDTHIEIIDVLHQSMDPTLHL